MPRFDGTGPWGSGSGTGWGLGPCGAGKAWRRGWGRGFGREAGWRKFWRHEPGRKEEKEMLEDEMVDLEEEMKAVKARLAELKGKNKN